MNFKTEAIANADAHLSNAGLPTYGEMLAALYDALPYVEDVLADKAQLACFKPGVVQGHAKAIRAVLGKAA